MSHADLPGKSPQLAAFEAYIDRLQERITDAVSQVDGRAFTFKDWTRPEGGGGRMGHLRGDVVEKGAVHVSKVHGADNPLTGNAFRAAGLSLILHPRNPHAATVHMNVRRFEEAGQGWWGGGIDLTPMGIWHDGDVAHFHGVLEARLGDRYAEGKAGADTYFFLPHRERARGAGGVFYDHLDSGDTDADLAFIRSIGDCFLHAYLPILESRKDAPYQETERRQQAVDRGRYVEFNLLYDRGTRFGLESGGNVEAILSSMPPEAAWP